MRVRINRRGFVAGSLLALALLSGTRWGWAAETPAVDPAATDSAVAEALHAFEVPGAGVAIVRDGQIVYVKGMGTKTVGKDEPVTPKTRFAIGSTTKAFTTTAMAMLADEGKLAWDDPVRKHIPYFHLSDPLADANVTLRDLVTHRTGLSRNDLLWYSSPYSREEIIRRIGQVRLTRPFRSAWQYQNIAFLTAGYAAGQAAGGTWEELVQRRILDPLGMRDTDFSVSVAQKAADHASPHLRNSKEEIVAIPWANIDNVGPAGSINASVRDMAKWALFQLGDGTWEGKRLVSAVNLEETHTPQMVIRPSAAGRLEADEEETTQQSYGMGWFVWDYRGKLVVSHGGNIDGFTARVTLLPRQKLGVVVLSNRNNSLMPTALTNTLVDQALGLSRKDWNGFYLGQEKKAAEARGASTAKPTRFPNTKPSRELAAYVGTYEEPAYGTVEVSLDGDRLVVEWCKHRNHLEHRHFDTFIARDETVLEGSSVTFSLDAEGDVAALTTLGVEFRRVRGKR